MCCAGVIFSSSEASSAHGHWELSLGPALVCQRTPKDLRESLSSDAVKLGEEGFEAGGVQCAQEENYLWEGKTGSEKNKFNVWLLKMGEERRKRLDFLQFGLKRRLDKLGAAHWGPQ